MSDKAALSPKLAEEFAGKAYGDLNRVQELLRQEPALVNAAWDWGGRVPAKRVAETALGAAAHMGRREIAQHLPSRGARIDLFAAAMLGKLPIVRAIIEENPDAWLSVGPHGIPLIVHAQAGGDVAAAVISYLQGGLEGER